MGDTHHDPIDHFRTTHQHAGEFFIDLYCWPGLISIALGGLSLIGSVAAAAYNHHEWVLTTAVVGTLAITGGTAWLVVEHHRVQRIESRWLARLQAEKPTGPEATLLTPTLRDETTSQQRHDGFARHNRIDWI